MTDWNTLKNRADEYRYRKQPGIKSMTLTIGDWDKTAAVVDAAREVHSLAYVDARSQWFIAHLKEALKQLDEARRG